MAITEAFNVTETVGATEWSFTTDTAGPDSDGTDGIYQAKADLSNLAAGDVFVGRQYEAISSAGTQRICRSFTFSGVQSDPIFIFPTDIMGHKYEYTFQKISGTDRSIQMSIWRVS